MRRTVFALALLSLAALASGCAARGKYHETALPDPKGFNAHFGNLDISGEGNVSWQEFKAYFPKAEPKVFSAVDLNKDGFIDHDEWHKFKEAHGLEHPD